MEAPDDRGQQNKSGNNTVTLMRPGSSSGSHTSPSQSGNLSSTNSGRLSVDKQNASMDPPQTHGSASGTLLARPFIKRGGITTVDIVIQKIGLKVVHRSCCWGVMIIAMADR